MTLTDSYDGFGDVTSENGNGATGTTAQRTFGYDLDGRVTNAATSNTLTGSTSNATNETFSYDDRGDLIGTTGSAGSSSFTYNGDGLLTSASNTIGTTTQATQYGYDNEDRLQTLNDAATGTQLTYGYSPTTATDTITYGTGGDTRTLKYDSDTLGDLSSDTLATASGATVQALSYTWDVDGNLVEKNDAAGNANSYTYDQADRLTSWTKAATTQVIGGVCTSSNGLPSGTITCTPLQCTSTSTLTCYSYDKDSNRTQVGANIYTYDARDELTSDGINTYAYTANGDLSSNTTDSGTTPYTNDAYGQQTAVGVVGYTYDATGRLISEQNPGSAAVNLTYQGAGNQVASDGTDSYTRDPAGNLIGATTPTGTSLLWTDLHTDVVGTFTGSATTLTGTHTYDPLGNTQTDTGNTANLSVGYQSEWTDTLTGEVNMDSRWYNPATGQFLNKDSAGNSATPNTANANPFAYADGNPLIATDPSGHAADFCATLYCAENTSGGTSCVDCTTHSGGWNDKTHWYTNDPGGAITPRKAVVANQANAHPNANEPSDGKAPTCSMSNRAAALNGICVGGGGGNGADLLGLAAGVGKWLANTADGVLSPFTNFYNAPTAASNYFAPADGGSVVPLPYTQNPIANWYDNNVTNHLSTSQQRVENDTANVLTAVSIAATVVDGVGELGVVSTISDLLDLGKADPEAASAVGTGDSGTGTVSKPPADEIPASDTVAAAKPTVDDPVKAPTVQPKISTADPVETTPAESNGTPQAGREPPESPACNSFTGNTGVLMADGTVKPIDQVKVGDEIENSVPGQSGTQTNAVTAVIVTTTDRDFVDVGIKPEASRSPVSGSDKAASTAEPAESPKASAGAKTLGVAKKLALGTAAAVTALATLTGATHSAGPANATAASAVSASTAHGGTLTTTYHHPFYDITQQSFIEAQYLHVGDELQTTTGRAEITTVHLYHADTVTYDLTIGSLHTFYVLAGDTPVLVHNLNYAQCTTVNARFAVTSNGTVTDLQEGPGQWMLKNSEKGLSARPSGQYQQQITQMPTGWVYGLGGKAFDGFDSVDQVVLDAKGAQYDKLFNAKWATFEPANSVNVAMESFKAAGDTPFRLVFAEEGAANTMRELLPDEIDVRMCRQSDKGSVKCGSSKPCGTRTPVRAS